MHKGGVGSKCIFKQTDFLKGRNHFWMCRELRSNHWRCSCVFFWGNNWNSGLISSPICPIQIIICHINFCYFSPSVSHSKGKCSETHCIGSAWEIGTHTFAICPFYRSFLPSDSHLMVYFITWEMCMGFLINILEHGKTQQNPSD